MGSGTKTPGRLKTGGQEEGGAAAAGRGAKPEATVDIGALLRNKRSGLLGTSGSFGSLGGSKPAAPAGGAPAGAPAGATLGGSFGGGRGLDVITAENPIYSPDDSLARAASKLQSLKAPQPRAPSRAAQAQAAIAAAAAPPLATVHPPDASPEPAPERCESPHLMPAFPAAEAGEQQAPAPAGEGSHKGLSGEDSGELAALSALQKRRKSLGPATAAKQRYGEWFDGSDKDLEHTLQEYNREAPAPSPRMTRAQRRKSLAVDQSMALEPGLARSLLDRSLAAEEEEEEREGTAGRGQGQQQQVQVQQAAAAGQAQQQKRGAAGRRKSVAATQQVQVALPTERPAPHARHASVADEVAALNAEMCAALSGLVGEESPEKGHRGDQRPLREKLLESWDGKTYYERLLAMQDAEQEGQQADKELAASSAKQQRGAAGVHAGKHAARTPGEKAAAAAKTPAAAAAHPPSQPAGAAQAAAAAQPARATPSPLQVALAGSSAVAAAKAALMTPNSQRRKLNELTESLQLLKVSTRQSRAAAAIQAAHQQRGSTPAPDSAAPAPPPAAASGVVGSRSVSPEPPAPAASDHVSTEPSAAPKTAGKRGGRRGTSPPTEASAALAPVAPPAVLPQASAAPSGQGGASQVEMGAVQQRLDAAVADNASLAEQLRQAQAELAAERAARAAEQQELEQLRAKRKEEASALKAAEQRAKHLSRELQEAQASAAAHAKSAAELETRWAEAEKALGAVLKAANSGLKAVAAGKEEAKSLGEALRSCVGGVENAPAAPAVSSGRSRQSSGRQWR